VPPDRVDDDDLKAALREREREILEAERLVEGPRALSSLIELAKLELQEVRKLVQNNEPGARERYFSLATLIDGLYEELERRAVKLPPRIVQPSPPKPRPSARRPKKS
jgi:hypothetical protein